MYFVLRPSRGAVQHSCEVACNRNDQRVFVLSCEVWGCLLLQKYVTLATLTVVGIVKESGAATPRRPAQPKS